MQAIGDKVIVKPILKDNKTVSGIIVNEAVRLLPTEGIVLSVGSEVKYLKKGNHILFSPSDYDELKDEEVFIMSEYSVWAIIKNEKV